MFNVAFWSSVIVTAVLVGGIFWYMGRRPAGTPVTWGEAMVGAVYVFFLMFWIFGVVYDRVHHRNLDEFGGLFGRMPVYTAMAIGIFFAGLGLPGLCGFPGEVFVVLAVFNYSVTMAVIAAAVVILTAGYILWTIQRVFLGPEYKGPHGDHLTPSNARENLIAGVIFVGAILFGILPHHLLLRYMEPTVSRQVRELADWTKRQESAQKKDDESAPAKAMLDADREQAPSLLAGAVPQTDGK